MAALDPFSGNLDVIGAAHLLRRATFGPTVTQINNFNGLNIGDAMEILFADIPDPDPPVDPQTGKTWLNPSASGLNSSQEDLTNYFTAWHMEQMRKSGTSIKERIVWFLHSHLPVQRSDVEHSESIYYQNALFRYYAFGSFKTLFRKICVDNAMLHFLDNNTNDVADPNENFAREMFELYSIGRGPQISEGNYTNYTEEDVRAATRVLTGYETVETYDHIDTDTGIPAGRLRTTLDGSSEVANRHDAGSKQFSSAFQNRTIAPSELVGAYATKEAAEIELDELIDMIFEQAETARFIMRKLYRYFVYYNIDEYVETNIIEPLATDFRTHDYSLEYVVRKLLSSQHFFDTENTVTADNNQGAIIKSPIELITGICNLFNVEFPTDPATLYRTVYQNGLLQEFPRMGLNYYEPFEVAGYPAYHQFPAYNRNWITTYSLAYRYRFADLIMNGVNSQDEDLEIQLDILSWVDDSGNVSNPGNAEHLVRRLTELLFPFELPAERFNFFLETVFLDGLYPSAWTDLWDAYQSNPGSNESSVRNRLETLLRSLLQAPESQLH